MLGNHGTGMNMDLAELIRVTRAGRTYDQLERDGGGQIGAARWQQIAKGGLNTFPTPATVVAISNALGVSHETVLLAIGTSLGLDSRRRSRLVDLIPDTAADLPDHCVTAILSTVRSMCALQQAAR